MLEKKIIDYAIVHATDLSTLRIDVLEYLKKGREPYGNIYAVDTENRMSSGSFRYKYIQVVVRYQYLYINPEECEKITGITSKQL